MGRQVLCHLKVYHRGKITDDDDDDDTLRIKINKKNSSFI